MKFEDIKPGKVYIDKWTGNYYTAIKYSMWKAWLFKVYGNRIIVSYLWVSVGSILDNIELADNTAQLLYGFEFKDE